MTSNSYDVVIIGAGAAGMMCAIEAGKRCRSVLIIDKASKVGRKILISGGGKCNFTNLYAEPANYVSNNPHFCSSALGRYSQWDFISLISEHGLTWEEREHGQLFCEESAKAIVAMLQKECEQVGVTFALRCEIETIAQSTKGFDISTNQGNVHASSLVVATGGPSIPKMGSTDFGLRIAKQFGLKNFPFRPALVPLTFAPDFHQRFFQGLSGISLDVAISNERNSFREQLLITHRGLSGPVALQISSYWRKGESISLNLLPDTNASEWLLSQQAARPKAELKTILGEALPKRLGQRLCQELWKNRPMKQLSEQYLRNVGEVLNNWVITPTGTEGMRTAEASTGGVDTDELSPETMETHKVKGLYFIGETVDVTGQLGGFNFQWAWSSGWCAGQVV